jgi:hypothetical protein
MIGLSVGPYTARNVATLTGSLKIGVFWLLAVVPLMLLALRRVRSQVAEAIATKGTRAAAAG